MLRLENVGKKFNLGQLDELNLYQDLNLEIQENEFVTIIGSNGSGKSTLLNVICGQVSIDFGDIKFDGSSIKGLKPYIIFKDIARVYQDPSAGTAPSLSVFENLSLAYNKGKLMNLKLGKENNRREEFKKMVEPLNLDLENKMDLKVSNLSGGQRQALSLLMALVDKPKLLLLDEHTAALDPKNSDIIIELTNELVKKDNITTIMITHNLSHALEYGNRLIMFHEGKIIADFNQEEKSKLNRTDLVRLFKVYDKYFDE